MKKILHVVHDDKFIDSAYKVFEKAAPGKNTFVIFSDEKELTYIKETPVQRYSPKVLFLIYFFPFLVPHFDGIVFHSLDLNKMRFLKAVKCNAKICWLGWGYDYYDLIGTELLKERTQKYSEFRCMNPSGLRRKLKKIYVLRKTKNILDWLLWKKIDKKKVSQKIDFFSPVLFEDYQLVKKAIPDFVPQYISWNYGTLEDDLIRGFEKIRVNGPNILLGNSAFLSNNHLDAFNILEAIDLDGRKIITPLSYGDIHYREDVIRKGIRKFADQFEPITQLMPIDEYIKTVSSCSIVIMNHLRQQAVGNIVIMLYLGAKVFLDKKNPVYTFFKKNNATIFSIDNIGKEIGSVLSDDDIFHNREILKKNWSRSVIIDKTKKVVESLCL